MLHQKLGRSIFFAVMTLVGGATLLPTNTASADEEQNARGHEQQLGEHIEGHIAFLKAELDITPAEETLWSAVAAVMRTDASDFERLKAKYPVLIQARETAPQHLEERVALAALRAKSEQCFLDAFRPLYQTLSDAQKKTADDLLGQKRDVQ
jgi:hypothetical protein